MFVSMTLRMHVLLWYGLQHVARTKFLVAKLPVAAGPRGFGARAQVAPKRWFRAQLPGWVGGGGGGAGMRSQRL